ncbi:MAG TPA: beta-ketoacyl synthase N-terminal-like domain-containing protein, partial [Verrucomicrobiae bacterium]
MSADASTNIFIHGTGAVSPAGWGKNSLLDAIAAGRPLPTKGMLRPGANTSLRVRQVPPPNPRPAWLAHSRLRRASPITQYMVAAALEAVGTEAARVMEGSLRLGVIVSVMSGCVNYSRRFYDETLRDPATASPLVFPETVFNAPGSHIAALLGTNAINYTLVGDPGTFLQALALAADWLTRGEVDGCLVVGAEEIDWLTSQAFRLFHRDIILSEGAGAVYLRCGAPVANPANARPGSEIGTPVKLAAVTDSHLFTPAQSRIAALRKTREQLSVNGKVSLLVDGLQNLPRYDEAERAAWLDWSSARISPKKILGEGLMAAAAWQTVLAIDAVEKGRESALVSVA